MISYSMTALSCCLSYSSTVSEMFFELYMQDFSYTFLTSKNFIVITEIGRNWFYHRVMLKKLADRIANSEDPNQAASPGAV